MSNFLSSLKNNKNQILVLAAVMLLTACQTFDGIKTRDEVEDKPTTSTEEQPKQEVVGEIEAKDVDKKDLINESKRDSWKNQFYNQLKDTGMNKKEAEARSIEMLKQVKIANPETVNKSYPFQLSGGMRQRVMIAMALACKPKLLIADEPTTALDVTIQAQILKLMNELKAETGTAIMFITHDLGVINQMADDVAVMYCGQVVETAPVDNIFMDSEYIHPYTEGLLTSIPRLNTKRGEKLDVIPGSVPHPLALPQGCKFAPRCKYATEKCRNEEPELKEIGPNHQIRCFFPVKTGGNK